MSASFSTNRLQNQRRRHPITIYFHRHRQLAPSLEPKLPSNCRWNRYAPTGREFASVDGGLSLHKLFLKRYRTMHSKELLIFASCLRARF